MSIDLHVVTPCARPGNLPRIAESIRAAQWPEDVHVHWLVVLDDRYDNPPLTISGAEVVTCRGTTGVAGHAQRNDALERIDCGWTVFVDDDNLLHPALPQLLSEAIAANPGARFIVFDQDLGGDTRRAAPRHVRVGEIDSAQFAFERGVAGEERFDVYAYSADGLFASRLFKKQPAAFRFVSKTASYYNALNRGRFGETPPGRQSAGPLPKTLHAGSLYFHRLSAAGEVRAVVADGRHQLYVSAGSVLRSPLNAGRLRFRGRAWLRSSGKAELEITMNGTVVVRRQLRFRPLLRLVGGRRFDATVDTPEGGAALEVGVTGSGTVVLELRIQ